MANFSNDVNLSKCLENQCKATQEVKEQYDKLMRQKDQHVQLLIGLQRKGYFLNADETSGRVNNSVSNIGKSVTLPIKKSIEERLIKENRFITIEVDALKQQLRDVSQDRTTLVNNQPDLEAGRHHKSLMDDGNQERVATLLQEIQFLDDEIRKNNAEKEQLLKLLSIEKENAKFVGSELAKMVGDKSGQIDVDLLIVESQALWKLLDQETRSSKNSTKNERPAFWTRGQESKALHLEDIRKLLKIIKKEKTLGPEGAEGLQKMSLALLESIHSKSNLLHVVEMSNKLQGARLNQLEKVLSNVDEMNNDHLEQSSSQDSIICDEAASDPTEIEFEQPHSNSCNDSDLFSIFSTTNHKSRKC